MPIGAYRCASGKRRAHHNDALRTSLRAVARHQVLALLNA